MKLETTIGQTRLIYLNQLELNGETNEQWQARLAAEIEFQRREGWRLVAVNGCNYIFERAPA